MSFYRSVSMYGYCVLVPDIIVQILKNLNKSIL